MSIYIYIYVNMPYMCGGGGIRPSTRHLQIWGPFQCALSFQAHACMEKDLCRNQQPEMDEPPQVLDCESPFPTPYEQFVGSGART